MQRTKLEEAGTMNVFIRINDTLLTAPTSERILDGVTRKSLIALAEKNGIDVEIRSVLVDELVTAAKNGSLKEIFGAGTAAVVNPIAGFSYRDQYFNVDQVDDSMALKLKKLLTDIQYCEAKDEFGGMQKI